MKRLKAKDIIHAKTLRTQRKDKSASSHKATKGTKVRGKKKERNEIHRKDA